MRFDTPLNKIGLSIDRKITKGIISIVCAIIIHEIAGNIKIFIITPNQISSIKKVVKDKNIKIVPISIKIIKLYTFIIIFLNNQILNIRLIVTQNNTSTNEILNITHNTNLIFKIIVILVLLNKSYGEIPTFDFKSKK